MACQALAVDRPVDQTRSRSTDVHRRAQDGPVDRTVDRQRVAALWKRPRSTGRSTAESLALCILATVDRPVDRGAQQSVF